MAYDPRLGDRFMFDAEDLAANTRGAVSAEQARMLDATAGVMARREPRVMGMLGIVFLIVSIRTTSTGTWYAHAGPARFSVDRYQSEVLQEDARYRVHYLDVPDGGIPLSLERA